MRTPSPVRLTSRLWVRIHLHASWHTSQEALSQTSAHTRSPRQFLEDAVWFEREIRPCLKAEAFQFRYADDFVLIFASERDARRVEAVLPKRFAKYSLRLHPTKTRLLRFKQPSYEVRRIWRKWLSHRSQRGYVNWAQFLRLSERYPLPVARVVHSVLRHSASP